MKGKVILITGGSSGIGKALAYAMAKRGGKVIITGRDEKKLKETEAEFSKENLPLYWQVADVSRSKDHEKTAEFINRTFGKVDLLVNNAGISMRALFEEVDLETFRKVVEINFFGTVYATKYCLPLLKKGEGGIIGISSVAGFRGLPARSGYSASKFAMHGFLESLRTEWAYHKQHILIVSPGFIATNIRNVALTAQGQQQMKSPRQEAKMMTADECAEKIINAFAKRKKHLVLTSQGKFLYWVNRFFGTLIDRMVYNNLAAEPNSPLKNPKNLIASLKK